ncbi:MAG TPA: HigA family addiction module antitoxin [Candidatus Elarobacter sp.]|nr:HigA family addiction module antitoxin [Candidatus Elarobacter sp.]
MRLPKNRRPTPPGEILVRQYLTPLGVTLTDFAERIGVTRARLSEITHGKRGVTPNTALRLARVLRTSPELWLNLQQRVDLWDELHSENADEITRLRQMEAPARKTALS